MAGTRLFPLVLTPFERFLLMAGTQAYPSNMIIKYEFSGEVLREPFEAALEEALQRHPLLTAVVQTGKRGLPCFKQAPNQQPWIDWGTGDEPLQPPFGGWIDLSCEAGLRVWVRNRNGSSSVTFQFHHSCTDGIGAHRFIGDILALYGQRIAPPEEAPALTAIEPGLLRDRRKRSFLGATDDAGSAQRPYTDGEVRARHVIRDALLYLFRYLLRPIAPLKHPRPQPLPDEAIAPFPQLHTITLDKAQCKRLRYAAAAGGVTANDLLVAAMMATLADWNGSVSRSRASARLQLVVPTDLRARGDERAPAANYVGWLQVTRKAKECRPSKELARSVYLETANARRNGAGTEISRALTAVLYVPGLMRAIVRWRERSFPTAILTNLGDVGRRVTATFPRQRGRLVAGNLTLERVYGSAPIGLKTRLSVTVHSYNRTSCIAMRVDPKWYDEQAHCRLLTMFQENLEELLAALEGDEASSSLQSDEGRPEQPRAAVL